MNKYFIYILIFLNFALSQEIIGEGLYEEELISYLQNNFKTPTTLSYNNARDILYAEVDKNTSTNQVKCIYTNYSVTLPGNVDPSTHLYENGMNCEHLWPQSMYEIITNNNMKSDMHHLRPCKENANSYRSNKPFNESLDNTTNNWLWLNYNYSSAPSSNIAEYSENNSSIFEPREDVKGDIARAMFYFYTIYENEADNAFFNEQKDILFDWHVADEITQEEIIRTNLIATYQNNIPNPFILDSTLINRCYFNTYNLGDINQDGYINITDIVTLVSYIVGSSNLNSSQMHLADTNEDGFINIIDIVQLINFITGE